MCLFMLIKFLPEMSKWPGSVMWSLFQKQPLQCLNVSIKQAKCMRCSPFQWRNLNGCKLPGKPLYLFVPLVWLSMSLISWEEAMRGGVALPAHTLESPLLVPHTQAERHTQPHSPILCASMWELRVSLSPVALRIIKYTSITADRYTSGCKRECEGN